MKNEKTLEVAIKASVIAGKFLLKNYNSKIKPTKTKESYRDVATSIDNNSENLIINELLKYDDGISIYTEEQGNVNNKSNSEYWIIDALDGTVNFLNQIPFFCVSIAYIKNNIITSSAIYAPIIDDLYFASRGIGSFKNNSKLEVVDSKFEESLFSVAFSGKNNNLDERKLEFDVFREVNDNSRGCLRTGSAALNLALLSEGSLNGCFGKSNKYWDISAGLLISELAGNKVNFNLKDNFLCDYIASRESVFNELFKISNKILSLNK